MVIPWNSHLCSKQWMSESYQHKDQARMVQDFLLEESSEQLVTEMTRFEIIDRVVQRNSYTDVIKKVTGPFIETVGYGDHLGVRIIKYYIYPTSKPQVINKRV